MFVVCSMSMIDCRCSWLAGLLLPDITMMIDDCIKFMILV